MIPRAIREVSVELQAQRYIPPAMTIKVIIDITIPFKIALYICFGLLRISISFGLNILIKAVPIYGGSCGCLLNPGPDKMQSGKRHLVDPLTT